MKRKTDSQDASHFRTIRMFEEGGQWFYRVRDGGVMGPFADEVEAINQLEIFIRQSEAGLLPERLQIVIDKRHSINNAS